MFKPIFGISLLTSFCATLALAQQQPAALPDSIASVPFCHAFRFPITNFTAKDYNGFTQNWAITQDDRGVIYVANGNALLQYDGTSWKSFPTKLGRQLRSLDIDAGNKPWFGAMGEAGFFAPDSSGQLVPNNCITGALSNNIALSIVWNTHVIYDGDDTTKQTAVFNDLQAVYLCNDTLIGAVRPRKKSFQSFAIDGNIWIHYPGKGIALLTPPDTGIFMFTGSEMFSELSVFAVIKYAPNKVFLVTRENGFFAAEYNTAGSRDTVHRVSANMAPVLLNTRSFTVQDENSLIEAQVYGGCLTGTNELAVNTIRNGLFIYDCCGVLRKRFDRHDGLMNESVKFVYPVRVDLLWLALNNGIAVVEHNSPVAVAKEGEFFSGGVEDIVRAGNMIYFATQQGVYRFFAPVSPELVDAPFNARFTADIFHDILPVEGINDQCWDLLNTGREIFVAANSCLFVINEKKTGNMEPGAADGFIPGIEAVKVAGIMSYALSDVKGRDDVLLTGGRQGLAVVVKHAEHVPGNTGWKTLTVIGGFPDEIISLKQDFSLDSIPVPDTLWKATSSKSQVPSSKSQVPSPKFQVSSPKSQILNSKSQIYSFWADFRYAGAALIRFNADFTKYAVQYFDTAHGLPTGVIQAFHLGASGAGAPMVVFGTDKGLFKYVTAASSTELNAQYRNRRTFSFVHDSTLGEFFVDTTVAVFRLANKNTDVWLTASKGEGIIKRVILTDNKTILDTIPFLCFDIGQINALCPDSGGIVWFGGADGIIRYDSRVRKNYKPVYHTLIRQVSVANDSVIFWGEFWDYDPQGHLTKNGAFRNGSDVEYDDLAGQASPYSRKITRHQPEWMLPTLAYKDNSITIQFAAPFFERPDKLVYSWQLEGYDTVWTKWKNENKAVYTNLGEGTYVFRVKAKNIYRHESTIAEYKFVIKPPWYRTWWAYSLYGLCLLLLLSLTALLFSWNLRRKNRLLQHKINRATASIRQQKEKIEELYGDITDSINYAKRIQQAVLPDLSKGFTFGKGETFMEHFIFFRPKDVVSGDFFWATFVSGYLVVAVVDCTGHGVPGAFMSMLGVSFLNEIVRKKEVTNAAMVLNQLRASIIEALKQTGEEGTQKDGMDMSLVAINISTGPPDYDPQGHLTKSGTFRNGSDVEYDDLAGRNPAGRSYTTQWAGANNPLWIIRNPDPQGHINKSSEQRDSSSLDSGDLAGQVIEIKPNKMPVAVHIKMDGFTNHEIQLNSGDKLYLFSDGYPDQFGGPKGKKFKYLAFKKLLAETSHLLMKEQGEQIEMALDKWMNFDGKKYEQIDDITVMGIKI